MKVDRQEIVGVVTALEDWFTMNHEDRIFGYETRFESSVAEVESIYGVTTQRVEHPHYVPYVLNVVFDSAVLGKTAEQVRVELDEYNPRIWVGATTSNGKETINIVVHTMNEGEVEIVAKRLAHSLGKDQ